MVISRVLGPSGVAIGLALPAGASELVLGQDIPQADIVIIGEQHDHKQHHDNQAQIVAAIGPAALVFEMLTKEQVAKAEGVDFSDGEALGAALGWADSGWPDFALYHPIFLAASDAELFGAALPRDQMRASVTDGAASVFGPEAERFGLTDPLPQDQQAKREALQMTAHCNALPEQMLGGMVEAQRLRDAHFSRVALQALDTTGGPVVVITGNGHARTDWGMPAALRQAAPEVSVVSIGQVSGEVSLPFDHWIKTEVFQAEGDPCDAFKTN